MKLNVLNSGNTIYNRLILATLLLFVVLRIVTMAVAPLTDPSEGRYAQICQTMAITNDYVTPQLIHDEGVPVSFSGKPPLYFQLGGLCCEVFQTASISPRLPALFFGILTLLLVYGVVRRLRDESTAQLSVFVCFSSVLFYVFMGVAITDMGLVFAVTGAVLAYAAFLHAEDLSEKHRWSMAFFVFLALGMLTKGPVALLFAGMPIFLFTLLNNQWVQLRYHAWFRGIFLFVLIAAPWYILMQSRHPDFLEYFFINENFKRFIFKEYGDRYGAGREFFKGVAALWFLVVNLPWILVPLLMLFKAKTRAVLFDRSILRQPLLGLVFFGFVTMTLFLCLSSRVLIYYLLPTIPCFAIFVACKISDLQLDFAPAGWKKCFYAVVGLLFITTIVLFVVAKLSAETDKTTLDFYQNFVRAHPEFLNADSPRNQLYFSGITPYSANYYFRDQIYQHPKSNLLDDFKHRPPCYWVLSRDVVNSWPQNLRDSAFQWGAWAVVPPPAQ